MAVITALRSAGVRVKVDGAPWRTLPLEVVVRAGLAQGAVLERTQLRVLRRELRRHEALQASARALRQRDLSTRELEERLRRRGDVAPADREAAIGALCEAGLVDDARFAHSRAQALVERGHGDAAIRADLERRGIEADTIAAALAELEAERDRAAAIVAVRGGGPATARHLARRGFDEDVVEAAMAAGGTDAPRALR
jgi:SOS response regulatory protein OraA/RecX